MSTLKKRIFNLLLLFCFLPLFVNAHAPNQSYIFLSVYQDSIKGEFQITSTDLNKALNLNLKRDASIGDFDPYLEDIKQYILDHSGFSSKFGQHPTKFQSISIFPYEDLGSYFVLKFKLDNIREIPDELEITFNPIFEIDPTHRGIQVISYNWKAGILDNEAMISLTFTPDQPTQTLDLTDGSIWKGTLFSLSYTNGSKSS